MATAEDADSGDVEEGGYLAVLTSTGGKALQRSSCSALRAETPPVQNSLAKKIAYLSSYTHGTIRKCSGLETRHHWHCSVYPLY